MHTVIYAQWLETEFLGYLESSVKRRKGFTPSQKKIMQLSAESLEGLRITGYLIFQYMCNLYICSEGIC